MAPTKTGLIGPNGIGQDTGLTPVILGTRHTVTIPESVELLGVNRTDREATVEDVRLMREVVGDEVLIKASGGIHSKEFAYELIEAGADRIGTSNGVELVTSGTAEGGY